MKVNTLGIQNHFFFFTFFLLRQLGAIVAAGLAALLGANIFAGTTSEAILDDSPSQRNHK